MDIWIFQQRLSRTLLAWAGFSTLIGGLFSLTRHPVVRGLGTQFLVWGAINASIAFVGSKAANKRRRSLPDPNAQEVTVHESKKLQHVLGINAIADIFYILGGIWIVRRNDDHQGASLGHGLGIVTQGGFLLIFDLKHAWMISQPDRFRNP